MGKFQKKIEETENTIFVHTRLLNELKEECENQTLVYNIVLENARDDNTLYILKNNLEQLLCQIRIAEQMVEKYKLQKEYYLFIDTTN